MCFYPHWTLILSRIPLKFQHTNHVWKKEDVGVPLGFGSFLMCRWKLLLHMCPPVCVITEFMSSPRVWPAHWCRLFIPYKHALMHAANGHPRVRHGRAPYLLPQSAWVVTLFICEVVISSCEGPRHGPLSRVGPKIGVSSYFTQL